MRKSYTDILDGIQGWTECFGCNTKNSEDLDFIFDDFSDILYLPPQLCTVTQGNLSQNSFQPENQMIFTTKCSQPISFDGLKSQTQASTNEEKEEDKTETTNKANNLYKGSVYSKNYRQKRKERMKCLEEENEILKKRIDDLSSRLKLKQSQLNNIKAFSGQHELIISKLSQEVIKKLKAICAPDCVQKDCRMEVTEKLQFISQNRKMSEFLQFHQNYGFGGTKVQQLLEFHVDQFLVNLMKDCDKYDFIKCLNKQNLKNYKTPLDNTLMEFLQQTENQQQKKNQLYQKMRPFCVELKQKCRQFYGVFRRISDLLEKLNDVSKSFYSTDMELARAKTNTVLWFETNQETCREVRNLKSEWIQLIRSNNRDLSEMRPQCSNKKLAK